MYKLIIFEIGQITKQVQIAEKIVFIRLKH